MQYQLYEKYNTCDIIKYDTYETYFIQQRLDICISYYYITIYAYNKIKLKTKYIYLHF